MTRRPNDRQYDGVELVAGCSQRPDVIGPLLQARLKMFIVIRAPGGYPNTHELLQTLEHNTRRFDRRRSGREAATFQQQLCSGVLASFLAG